MGMSRQDADTEAVGAGFARRNRAAINIGAVAILTGLAQHRDTRILDPAVFGFTVISFDPDMLRIDPAKMDARTDFQRFTHRNVLSVLVADLHIINPDLRPIFADTRFPLAEIAGRSAIVLRKLAVSLRRGRIKPLSIFLDHAMSIENGRDAADRFAHQLEPGQRKFAVGLGVIKRDDLVFEQLIKAAGIHFVLELDSAIFDLGADGPAVVPIIAFAPPTIEHTEVEAAIRRRFHSAGAACFQRTQWIVQPKIDGLHQAPRNVSVVILDEDDAIIETGFAREFVNFLDQGFAAFVAWMRFAGENELNGSGGIVQQFVQAIFIGEEKRAAFVGSETSRKSDGENLGIENAIGRANGFGRFSDSLPLRLHPSADEHDQAQLQFLVRVPQNGIGNIHDPPPEILVGKIFFPIAEILVLKHKKFRGQPGFGMNPVSYVGDGHFVRGDAGPDVFPQTATDFAV